MKSEIAPTNQSAATMPPQAAEQVESWIAPLRSVGSLPPLFCACAGGGDVFDYRDLALALSETQPVYVFGVPPRGEREGPLTVQQLAAIYIREARKLQPQGPYRLCGHSFGGLVAFEMAALLVSEGEEVGLLALIDTLNPAFKRNMSAKQRVRFRGIYVADRVAKYAGNLAQGGIDRIALDVFLFCRARLKRFSFRAVHAVFRALDREIPSLIYSHELVLSAAWRAYSPRKYNSRIVLFIASHREAEYRADSTLGWQTCTTDALELQIVPGDHFSMLHPPLVSALAERLEAYLGPAEPPDREAAGEIVL